jgi:ABC-type sulfate transport system permease component
VFIALLFVTVPFVVRSVQPVLEALDRDVEEAAESLGAGPITVFRRVILPALAPAIASGAVLAFGRAMGEYGSVILIAGGLGRTQVASAYIYKQIQNYPARRGRRDGDGAAGHQPGRHVLARLDPTLGGRNVVDDIMARPTAALPDVAPILPPPATAPKPRRPSWARLTLRTVAVGYLLALVLAPVVVVFTRTIQAGLGTFWGRADRTGCAARLPAHRAGRGLAVAFNTVFGVGAALLLARYRFPGKRLFDLFIDLPIAISPIIVGLALVLVYGTQGGSAPAWSTPAFR